MTAETVSRITRPALLAVVTAILGGCHNIGPPTVAYDSFGYSSAISNSWKRQMLLNCVKIRYADVPVFLDVSSIITQYQITGELQGQLGWNLTFPTDSQFLLGRTAFANRPTIQYQPLRGDKFTRSLLRPIPPAAILSLIQGRHDAEIVLRICTQEINGLSNRIAGGIEGHSGDPDFYRLTALLKKIQASHAIGTRIKETDDEQKPIAMLFQKEDIEPEIADAIRQVKKMLGIDPDLQYYNVVYAALARDDKEIAILTRSMMDILAELASYIQIPEPHLAERRAPDHNRENRTELDLGVQPLISIHSDTKRPEKPFVEVRYKDHWFWIDDTDVPSKRVFSFLMVLFSLAETGPMEPPPLVTIPTG